MDYAKLLEEFNALSEVEQWGFIIHYKNDIVFDLENDSTLFYFRDEQEDEDGDITLFYLKDDIGNSYGLVNLFEYLKIEIED